MKPQPSRKTRLIAVAGLILVLVGCSLSLTTSPDESTESTKVTERVASSEIWNALARAVDARTIDSTTRLAQFVVVLARNGELTSNDTSAFDQAFPDAIQNGRPLTAADSQRLLELAKRTK